jgi:autophagy-related protein 18
MLFSTSLVAYVGAGDQPALTPRKLALASTAGADCAPIRDVPFVTAVLAVRLNRASVVAVLEREAHVLELRTLAPRPPGPLPTPRNPSGLAALSCGEGPGGRCLLALPAHERRGAVRVYDLTTMSGGAAGGGGGGARAAAAAVGGGPAPGPATAAAGPHPHEPPQPAVSVLCDLEAHCAPLSALAFSPDGGLLATASATGTVVRVHRMPGGGSGSGGRVRRGRLLAAGKPLSLRRGTVPAAIHSIAFSCGGGGGGGEDDGVVAEPEVLAVASGQQGSVHLFRLWEDEDEDEDERRGGSGGGANGGSGGGGGGGGGGSSGGGSGAGKAPEAARALSSSAAPGASAAAAAAAKAGGRAARTLVAAAGGVVAAAAARWRAAGGEAAARGAPAAPSPPPSTATDGAGATATTTTTTAKSGGGSIAAAAAARRPALTLRLPAEAAGAPCVVGVRACTGPGGRDGEAVVAGGSGELDLDLLREAAALDDDEEEDEGGEEGGGKQRRRRRRGRRVRRGQQYRVCVASARGTLYVYRVEGLHDSRVAAPKAVLVGVHSLLSNKQQQ